MENVNTPIERDRADRSSSIRDDIQRQFDEFRDAGPEQRQVRDELRGQVNQEPAEDAPANGAEKPRSRAKDPISGKFVKGRKTSETENELTAIQRGEPSEPINTPDAEPSEHTPASKSTAPTAWSAEARAEWDRLPENVKAACSATIWMRT